MTALQMSGRGLDAYKTVNVITANPGRVLVTLYDAAIKNVSAASEHIARGDIKSKGESLSKAYAIIAEFINALDPSVAPELCDRLSSIYTFMLDKITEANVGMVSEPLVPVLTHLRTLRETWALAIAAPVQER